ncbi:MAG: LPXTG cell wall anchor domain-containing protein [Clostridia bacterium]|nr:LPXTG cell wall anchor domain-containing protein [Clostridia bacterium]
MLLFPDGIWFWINYTGATLPSTGGVGTTIFYVAGSLMVLAAAILLITKRRMGAGE